MFVNSLISGLITYTASIVYNLLARKSMESVFFLSLRFLVTVTLMMFFLQLSFHLIKSYKNSEEMTELKEQNETEKNNGEVNTDSQSNTNSENVDIENTNQSTVENEFENFNTEEFSALDSEEFDYQQENN